MKVTYNSIWPETSVVVLHQTTHLKLNKEHKKKSTSRRHSMLDIFVEVFVCLQAPYFLKLPNMAFEKDPWPCGWFQIFVYFHPGKNYPF